MVLERTRHPHSLPAPGALVHPSRMDLYLTAFETGRMDDMASVYVHAFVPNISPFETTFSVLWRSFS